jgi:hypothetical protein
MQAGAVLCQPARAFLPVIEEVIKLVLEVSPDMHVFLRHRIALLVLQASNTQASS